MRVLIRCLVTAVVIGFVSSIGWVFNLGEEYALGIAQGVSLGFAVSLMGHVFPIFKDYTDECEKRRQCEKDIKRLKQLLEIRGWEDK